MIAIYTRYEGCLICNALGPLLIVVRQQNLAQLLVSLYIGTTQSYTFLSLFNTAL